MRHVAAHRLADAAAGKLGELDRERVAQHVASCERCRVKSERVARARAAMDGIAAQSSPELGWDQIGVRLYWESSSAKHRAMRHKQMPWWRRRAGVAVFGGAVVAAAVTAALVMWPPGEETGGGARAGQAAAAAQGVAPLHVAAPALTGVVTFASGPVTVDGVAVAADRLFSQQITAGATIATGEGRLVVQFGAGSGFALAPRSTATLARFDDGAIELHVDGEIEVTVAKLRAEQAFDVVAGRHRVGVRGTAFRVEHRGDELEVTCAHGRVVVTDGDSEVALAAGQAMHLLRDAVLAHVSRVAVDPAELAELESTLAAPLLPAWTAPRALLDTSSTLDVAAAPGRGVRIDGVDVGDGAFSMRVMSGRHHLEVVGPDGRWGTGTWFDAAPGGRQSAPIDRPSSSTAAPTPRAAKRLRSQQLSSALEDRSGASLCMEPLEKRDLVAGSYIVFDIGINADGTQGHLNVVDSNVPPEVASCLRRVVDAVELPAGPAATIRHRLAF